MSDGLSACVSVGMSAGVSDGVPSQNLPEEFTWDKHSSCYSIF